MNSIREEIIVQAPLSTAYSVAANVADYPNFLPGVTSVKISGDIVKMSVRLGPIEVAWKSRAVFIPNRTITVSHIDGPFSHMRVLWTFVPVEGGTHVAYDMKFKLDLPVFGLEAVVTSALRKNARGAVAAFKKRALEIHRNGDHQPATAV